MLVGEELGEGGLLLGGAGEDEGEVERGVAWDGACVSGGVGPAGDVAGEADGGGGLGLVGDAICLLG